MREDGCSWCGERRDETGFGLRVWSGRVSDTYFARHAFVRGCAVVVWRGRHVVEPVDLSPAEADLYHREVLTVARAIRDCFRPPRLDYRTTDDGVPHLHTRVTARFGDAPDGSPPLLEDSVWRTDAAVLKASLR